MPSTYRQLDATDRPLAIGLALRAAERAVRSACRPLLDDSGLTYAELLLLEALWEADGAQPASLARHVSAPLGVVCLQLERLQQTGWVECVECVDEMVWLTPKGFALRRHADDALASPAIDRIRLAIQSLDFELAE